MLKEKITSSKREQREFINAVQYTNEIHLEQITSKLEDHP